MHAAAHALGLDVGAVVELARAGQVTAYRIDGDVYVDLGGFDVHGEHPARPELSRRPPQAPSTLYGLKVTAMMKDAVAAAAAAAGEPPAIWVPGVLDRRAARDQGRLAPLVVGVCGATYRSHLAVRLTPRQRARFTTAATSAEVTLSEWIRQAVLVALPPAVAENLHARAAMLGSGVDRRRPARGRERMRSVVSTSVSRAVRSRMMELAADHGLSLSAWARAAVLGALSQDPVPPGDIEHRKTVTVAFLCTPAERAAVDENARRHGVTRANLVRRHLVAAVGAR